MIATVLMLATLQVPQAPGHDVIRLDVGTEIHGTIEHETEDYVEIRLGEGMIVGFEKARAVAIVRGTPASGAAARGTPRDAVVDVARDQWYALHDGQGHAVGWLHETAGCDDDGAARFGEEWRFGRGDTATEITVLETLDAEGRPHTCFYRERVRDESDRIVSERVVRGVVDGDRFEVGTMSLSGTDTSSYRFAPDARFPLELRATLRRDPRRRSAEFQVYDPSTEEWMRESYELGELRTVEHRGSKIHARVLRQVTADGVNVEWLDGASQCIRREIAGPALVAVPMSEDRAIELSRSIRPCFEPALAVEAGERFAIWLPNPLWAVGTTRHGEITAQSEVMSATMSLVLLDQLGPDVLLDTAVDTVERWLRLAHADIEFSPREPFRLRGGEAVRLRGTYQVRRPGEAIGRSCDVVVFEAPGIGVLSFCGDAPSEVFGELRGDFDNALRAVEPQREGFAPELRGPVGLK